MISDKDKLEALIGRAIEGGWKTYMQGHYTHDQTINYYLNDRDAPSDPELLFNKDFNKAIFGDQIYVVQQNKWFDTNYEKLDINLGLFQFHMQQAVISLEPISYLYQAVFGEDNVQ